MTKSVIFVVCLFSFVLFTSLRHKTQAELFTSVDELSKLEPTIKFYARAVDKLIAETNVTLQKLNKLSFKLTDLNLSMFNRSSSYNPIQALRLIHTLAQINIEFKNFHVSGIFTCKECMQVSKEDLIGSAQALIRLQKFYSISANDLFNNQLSNRRVPRQSKPILSKEDCFIIGKIAFDAEEYPNAIEWLQIALNLVSKNQAFQNEMLTVKVLEYLAFAAFKNGQLKYAAQLTRNWLSIDKLNDKARRNLHFYLSKLNSNAADSEYQEGDTDFSHRKRKNQEHTASSDLEQLNLYDNLVRNLCSLKDETKPSNIESRRLYCFKQPLIEIIDRRVLLQGQNVEILSDSPLILRVYDFVSSKEAEYLIKTAKPKLARSTVQTSSGEQIETNYRIAKTAWLSSHSNDDDVGKIESRIRDLLDLDDSDSEDLQVVNYGLGGFYGPHVDATRANINSRFYSLNIANDRAVTALIYLSNVEIGGATVFPNIRISIEPIKNSLIVWYNLLRNGTGDERTLHTGCPVLLGSKWIATKWIRENANAFRRPCSLKRNE